MTVLMHKYSGNVTGSMTMQSNSTAYRKSVRCVITMYADGARE